MVYPSKSASSIAQEKRRKQSVMVAVYTQHSCEESQQRSQLSQYIAFLCAFPKTYSPSPVVAGTWINYSSRTQHMNSKLMTNDVWDKLVKHWACRIDNTISKMFSENVSLEQTENVWSEAEVWDPKLWKTAVCLFQHELEITAQQLYPSLPLIVMAWEWVTKTLCWAELALLTPMASVRE